MIRKSGNRFSEKIMLNQNARAFNRFNLKRLRSRLALSPDGSLQSPRAHAGGPRRAPILHRSCIDHARISRPSKIAIKLLHFDSGLADDIAPRLRFVTNALLQGRGAVGGDLDAR